MIGMNPSSYRIDLQNMSKEKVPFRLPVVFTIGPHDPESSETSLELFKNYAKTMINGANFNEVENTVNSVVTGEARILSASMTIEEMFSDRDKFKQMVSENIQRDLDQFGLKICNANIEEMHDLPKNDYFEQRKQKALAGASTQARIDIAEANKLATIGEQERAAATKQRIAQLHAETVKIENERDQAIAETTKDLEVAKAHYARDTELARIEAQMKAKMREIDMQRDVEESRVRQEMQTSRAKDLVKATVDAESRVAQAQGEFGSKSKLADAELYVMNTQAEAKKRMADADVYAEQKRAEGLSAVYQAEANGVQQILQACEGNAALYQFKLAVSSNLYPQLAAENAKAIHGLQPKINIWNTGNGGAEHNTYKSIQDIVRMIPPMMDVLNTQTDLKLPFTKSPGDKSSTQ